MSKMKVLVLQCSPVEPDGAMLYARSGSFAKLGNADRHAQRLLNHFKMQNVQWNSADAEVFSMLAEADNGEPGHPLHHSNVLTTAQQVAKCWDDTIADLEASASTNSTTRNKRLAAAVLAVNDALYQIAGKDTRAALLPDFADGVFLAIKDPESLRLVSESKDVKIEVSDAVVTGHDVLSPMDLLSADVDVSHQVALLLNGPIRRVQLWISLADLERVRSFRSKVSFTAVRRRGRLSDVAGLSITTLEGDRLTLGSLSPA